MSIEDIARALGVSKTTVSRAISGRGRVSAQTRSRILAYVQEKGFIPNASASNLATTRTMNIAYSMPLGERSIASTYYLELLFGISSIVTPAGYNVIVVDDKPEELMRVAASHRADGMVLSSFNHGEEALEKLVKTGMPIVYTGTTQVEGLIQVQHDQCPAFRNLTDYLCRTWRLPLGLILTWDYFPANQSRAEEFTREMAEKGVSNPVIGWNCMSEKELRDELLRQYRLGVRGIICGDDSVCSAVFSLMQSATFQENTEMAAVMREIRLASFASNRFMQVFHPEVPSVAADPTELGIKVGETMIRQIEHGDAPPSIYLSAQLHLGS